MRGRVVTASAALLASAVAGLSTMAGASPLPEAQPWSEIEQLNFEKETLGLYWSGHPVDRYASALKDFGDACGLEIYSPAQKRLAEMAAEARVSYKPCGAGGDFGVVFAEDSERLATFERAIVRADMHVIPLPLDSQGVSCHMRQVGSSPLRDPLA